MKISKMMKLVSWNLLCWTRIRIQEGINDGNGWLSWYRSARACYGSSLGSNPDISQKYKMGDGDISKGVANTLKPEKNIQKLKNK